MKTNMSNIHSSAFTIIVGITAAVFLFSCTRNEDGQQAAEKEKPASANEITFTADQYRMSDIATQHVEKRDLSNIVKVNGVIDVEPQSIITISAPLGGYVKSAGLLPGQVVKKGEAIVTLENPEFINLQQEYLESVGKFQYTEQEFLRQQKLRQEDVNSSKTFQQVTSDYRVLQARISGLEEKIKLAGIDLETVRSGKISSTARLYSPINGFVKTSNVNIGKYVNPTDVVLELTDKSDLHLALNVFEKDIDKIHVGQTVQFALATDAEFSHTANVFLIGQASGDNRTIPVHCHFNEKNTRFLPGMYVKAWIETGTESQSTVPTTAILQSEGQDVIVIETSQSNTAHMFKILPVKVGIQQGAYTAITLSEGVDTGSLSVVVKGAYNVLSAIKNTSEEE